MLGCFASIFIASSLIGAETKTSVADNPNPLFSIQENVERFSDGNNVFGLELYHQISQLPGNLCFSPYGIESGLSLPYIGSKDVTQIEMEKVLHLQGPQGYLDETISYLNQQLATRSGDTSDNFRLLLASSFWLQNGLSLETAFLEKMKKSYALQFRRAEFMRQPESARVEINEWVKDRTLSKITNLFAYNDINKSTRMVSTTCLYLKAKWAQVFNPLNTNQEPFFIDEQGTISVPMMVLTGLIPYYKDETLSIIELETDIPRNGKTRGAMMILLPSHKEGLKGLEASLDWNRLQKWKEELKKEHVQVRLPRFKSSSNIKLSDALQKMGMAHVFNDEADFSGINKSASNQLKLNELVHKSQISVDEAGIEAVSASGITGAVKSAVLGGNPSLFLADHPFIYIIYDKTTNVILMIGRVKNPLEK